MAVGLICVAQGSKANESPGEEGASQPVWWMRLRSRGLTTAEIGRSRSGRNGRGMQFNLTF